MSAKIDILEVEGALTAGSVTTVAGASLDTHASRHNPGGADSLATAAPITITPNQANGAGTALSYAKSDHIHNIVTAAPVSQTPDQAAADGVATTFSKSDHIHPIPTAVPVTLNPDQANAQGNAASFARSNHVHQVPTAIAVNTGTANSQGVSTSFSRADHIHDTILLNYEAAATTRANLLTTATDTLLTDMQILNVAAGTYIADFQVNCQVSNNGREIQFALFVNGVEVTHTRRYYFNDAAPRGMITIRRKITVGAGQTVEVRWNTTANTGFADGRTLHLLRTGP